MTLDLQFKIKNNENYLKYLRQNSYWYKYLNRNSNSFKDFENEVKKFYKMYRSDKIMKTLEMAVMASKMISTFK